MIETGATRKYLFYAIGEILLVMIGILLALQVNNWNEIRKSRALEKEILQELKIDLQATRNDLNDDMLANEIIRSATHSLLKHMIIDLPYNDSLVSIFSLMLETTTIFKKTSAYETLKSRGLELISNTAIRNGITDFYELSLPRSVNTNLNIVKETLIPYMQTRFDINLDSSALKNWPTSSSLEWRKGKLEHGTLAGFIPLNYEEIKEDAEFRVLLRQAISTRRGAIARYRGSIKDIDSLIPMIEKDILNWTNK